MDAVNVVINPDEQAELDNIFSYHKPFGDQPARYEALRSKAKELGVLIIGLCPRSADRSAALRKLREAVMTANASIAINEKEPVAELPPAQPEAAPEQPAAEPAPAAQ